MANKLVAVGLLGIGGIILWQWQKNTQQDESETRESPEYVSYGSSGSSGYDGAPDGALTSGNAGTTYNINLEAPDAPESTMNEPSFKKESSSSPDLSEGREAMDAQGYTGESVDTDSFKGEVFKDQDGEIVGGYDHENQQSVLPGAIKKEEKSFADKFEQPQSTIY